MLQRQGLMERAFELARSGEFKDLRRLEMALTAEGYEIVASHLGSPLIRKQLNAVFRTAESASLL